MAQAPQRNHPQVTEKAAWFKPFQPFKSFKPCKAATETRSEEETRAYRRTPSGVCSGGFQTRPYSVADFSRLTRFRNIQGLVGAANYVENGLTLFLTNDFESALQCRQ